MNAYGQGSKPIFCTEGDWGTEGTGANQPTTNDAVAFMARHYLLNCGRWEYRAMPGMTGRIITAIGNLGSCGTQPTRPQCCGSCVPAIIQLDGGRYDEPARYRPMVRFTPAVSPGQAAIKHWRCGIPIAPRTSTFTVPSGYVQYRDLAGNLNSIIGSTVTIGIEPILLENMTDVTRTCHTFLGFDQPHHYLWHDQCDC